MDIILRPEQSTQTLSIIRFEFPTQNPKNMEDPELSVNLPSRCKRKAKITIDIEEDENNELSFNIDVKSQEESNKQMLKILHAQFESDKDLKNEFPKMLFSKEKMEDNRKKLIAQNELKHSTQKTKHEIIGISSNKKCYEWKNVWQFKMDDPQNYFIASSNKKSDNFENKKKLNLEQEKKFIKSKVTGKVDLIFKKYFILISKS